MPFLVWPLVVWYHRHLRRLRIVDHNRYNGTSWRDCYLTTKSLGQTTIDIRQVARRILGDKHDYILEAKRSKVLFRNGFAGFFFPRAT